MHHSFITVKRPEPELYRSNSDENVPPTELSNNCKMHQIQLQHCNKHSKVQFNLNSEKHISLKSNSHLTENSMILH